MLFSARYDPVENERAEQDRKACQNCLSCGELLQRLMHVLAQALNPDQRGDDNHRQQHQDGLVRQRQVHFVPSEQWTCQDLMPLRLLVSIAHPGQSLSRSKGF